MYNIKHGIGFDFKKKNIQKILERANQHMQILRNLNAVFQSLIKTYDYAPVVYKYALVRTVMLFKEFSKEISSYFSASINLLDQLNTINILQAMARTLTLVLSLQTSIPYPLMLTRVLIKAIGCEAARHVAPLQAMPIAPATAHPGHNYSKRKS